MTPTGLVSIDLREQEFIVQSSSKAKLGFWIANGFLERMSEQVPDDVLGECVARAAAESEIGVENSSPGVPLPALTKLLAEVGAKSYGRYMVDTKAVRAQFFDDGTVTVTPFRNAGSKEGFLPIVESAEDVQAPQVEALGKAVRAAFERAT
jgi:hypothetical protein